MVAEFALVAVGLVILLLAGDLLVKGAVNLSLRLGIPALIVSLTVVAFGTSAPELLIAIQAVLDDAPGLALGNVVGSNTANVLLVLGIPAVISRIVMTECDTVRSYTAMIAGSVLFIGLCFLAPLRWWHGAILLAAIVLILLDQAREARDGAVEVEGAEEGITGWRIALYLVLGLVGLPLGAGLLVDNAVVIAETFEISDTVIGLTLVAVGTSLPELATSVMAAIRRHAAVAVGNVIGSNMFNILGIIGVTGLVAPFPVVVDPEFLTFDLWVMLAASVLLAPFVLLRWPLGRTVGVGFCALYILYIGSLF